MESKNINNGNIQTNGGTLSIGDTTILQGADLLVSEYRQQIVEIEELINQFQLKTAYDTVLKLEKRIADLAIPNKSLLESKIFLIKGICNPYIKGLEIAEGYKNIIISFNLNKSDNGLKLKALYAYFALNDETKMKLLSDEIIEADDYNSFAWYIKFRLAGNSTSFLTTEVPQNVLVNSVFQLNCSYFLMEHYSMFNTEELKAYGIDLKLDLTKYTNLKFEVIDSWIIVIDLILNNILNKVDLASLHRPSYYLESTTEIDDWLNMVSIFINTLEPTEIRHRTAHQRFFYFIIKGIVSREETLDIISIQKAFDEISDKNWIHIQIYSLLLIRDNDVSKAVKILSEFTIDREVNNSSYYSLFFYANTLLIDNSDKLKKVFDEYIEGLNEINSLEVFNIFRMYLPSLKNALGIDHILSAYNELLLSKKFESENIKLLFEATFRIRFGLNYDTEKVYQDLLELKNVDFDIQLKDILTEDFVNIGKLDEAIVLIETYVNKNSISVSLHLYISLLHQRLYDENFDSSGSGIVVLELLEYWRTNSPIVDWNFLSWEHNLCFELDDYDKLIEIDQLLYEKEPQNIIIIYYFLTVLDKKKEFDLFQQVVEGINFDIKDDDIGSEIAKLLLKNNYREKGFEVLYSLAKEKGNIKARMCYFYLTGDFSDKFKSYEEVVANSWVFYTIESSNSEKHEIQINDVKGKDYKEFVGKKIGETIQRKISFTDEIVSIKIIEVVNDELKLFRDITKEAENPFNKLGLQMFSLPQNGEDFGAFLIKKFGARGSLENQRREDFLKDYFSYKLGFTDIINSVFNKFIDGYNYLTKDEKMHFMCIPSSLLLPYKKNVYTNYAIDYTSLMLFYQLSIEFNITFKHKFIISNLIKIGLENEISSLKISPNSSMNVAISMEGIHATEIPTTYNSGKVEYLEAILVWIDNSCIIDVVAEKLDIKLKLSLKKGEKADSEIFNILMDYMFIGTRNNVGLLTNDLSLLRFLYNSEGKNSINLLSIEDYIYNQLEGVDSLELGKFLLKNNYCGILISSKLLKDEFLLFLSQQENCYLRVLKNVEFGVCRNINIINIVSDFLREMYLMSSLTIEDKERYALDVIIIMKKGMDIKLWNMFKLRITNLFHLMGRLLDSIMNVINNPIFNM